MRNLLLLFLRNGGFITFLLLEIFCMFLVIRYNRTQRDVYINSSNLLSASIYKWQNSATKFLTLSAVTDSLINENARLLSIINNQQFSEPITIDSSTSTTIATLDTINPYTFTPAEVVNNSTNRNNNTLTLNKGYLHDIKQRQAVISDKGIVGFTRFVNKNFTTVMSILNRQLRISAAVQRNNHIGSLAWRGNDPTRMKLEDVPNHADLMIGDTIITSGYSSKFPRGITIGQIDTFWISSGNGFYDIEVKLSNDLNNLQYVYIIENALAKEKEKLEQLSSDEQ